MGAVYVVKIRLQQNALGYGAAEGINFVRVLLLRH